LPDHGLTLSDYEVLLRLDRRVVYAVLTEAGLEKLEEASRSHLVQVEELFADRYDAAELGELGTLLERLAEPGTPECAPGT
jgi:DNA-binding MarR family transcriptional regulator